MPSRLTPVVLNLIMINVLVFVLYMMRKEETKPYLELQKTNVLGYWEEQVLDDGTTIWWVNYKGKRRWMPEPDFKPIQVVTSVFTHLSIAHIVFNMLALAFLGSLVEMALGTRRFLEFYLFSGIFGMALVCIFDPSPMPVAGASGAISGLLVMMAYYYPHMQLQMMFIPISFTARNFAIFVAGGSAILIALQLRGIYILEGISHFGHLMGMVAAFLYFNRHKFLNLFRPR